MTKFLHIAALSVGVVTLIVVSLTRHLDLWPYFELVSYFGVVFGTVELRSLFMKGATAQTPVGFSMAMTLIALCVWTGGTPFQELSQAGILLAVAVFFWLISWALIRTS